MHTKLCEERETLVSLGISTISVEGKKILERVIFCTLRNELDASSESYSEVSEVSFHRSDTKKSLPYLLRRMRTPSVESGEKNNASFPN